MDWAIADPRWLALAAAAVPCAVIALRWFNAMSPVRRWSAAIARVLLFALIAAMLAGLSSVRRTDRVAVVAVVDMSGSVRRFGDFGVDANGQAIGVSRAARVFLEQASRERGPDDLLGVVVFDGRAIAAAVPSRTDVLDRSLTPIGREGSDLAGALRLAAGLVPPDASARLVVFSDGNETTGDAAQAGAELAASPTSGVRIDAVPIAYRVGPEVVVESVDAPPRAALESTITVRVVLRSTGDAAGVLRLTREGDPVDANGDAPGTGLALVLAPGTRVVSVPIELPPGRVHRFEAVFEPALDAEGHPVGDGTLANNRGSAFTITPGRGSVLIVDGAFDGRGGPLAGALRDAGLDVQVVPPVGVPRDVLAMQAYDLIVLQNVPAELVEPEQQGLLVEYVRDLGGGLVMVGGPDSFGAGGWNGTPIADVLPVRLDLPDKLVVPEAAVVFVLDSSGSMGRPVMRSPQSQQAIANESAALAIGVLDKRDLVGVIAFENSARLVVPLGPNDDPERSQSAVRSIMSGGGTNIPPALAMARRELAGVEAKLKHVIVLSDGQSQNAEMMPQLAADMRAEGIRVSTIAVGDEADLDTLRQTAAEGGGAFDAVSNPNVLPRVFLKAVRVIRSPLVRETTFDPVVLPTGSALTEGLGQPPALGGLVLTRARPEPTITYAMASDQGEPLLAQWPVGLGQVVAFTSDASEWAERWLDWAGYRPFWTRLVRQASRVPVTPNAEMRTGAGDGRLHITLDAVDDSGRPLDGLAVPVTVYEPSGGSVEVRLRQTGPGRYEGETAAQESGSYVAVATPRHAGTRLPPVLGGASVSAGVEYARLEPNPGLLARLADAGGGRVLSFADAPGVNLFDRANVSPRRALTPLWPVLLWWALFVFLADVGTRRIAWDRLVSKRFGADLSAAAAEAVRDRTRQAAASVGGLRSARERRGEQGGASMPAPAALGAEDAARVKMEQRRARLEAERARLRALREQQASPAPPEPRSTDPANPEEDGAAGLLAAKRRARERYQGDEPEA